MISRLQYTCIYVLDQNSAYNFYVNKLGFIVRKDLTMDFSGQELNYESSQFRWITVSPPDQLELEIILNPIEEGKGFTKETAEQMKSLVRAGTFGYGIWGCRDLNATYEELVAKGVEFVKPPTREPFAFEALFKDDSGNWFSIFEMNQNNL